nr:MAG TPA: hypothetical protein [Caudoviricetes sp.]
MIYLVENGDKFPLRKSSGPTNLGLDTNPV